MGEPRGYTQSVTISYGPDGVQTFSSSSGNPTVNINNTNNIHMNMGLGRMGHMGRMGNMGREDPFEMMQGLMGGMGRMPGMFVFREGEEQPQSRGVSEEFIDNLPPMKAGRKQTATFASRKSAQMTIKAVNFLADMPSIKVALAHGSKSMIAAQSAEQSWIKSGHNQSLSMNHSSRPIPSKASSDSDRIVHILN